MSHKHSMSLFLHSQCAIIDTTVKVVSLPFTVSIIMDHAFLHGFWPLKRTLNTCDKDAEVYLPTTDGFFGVDVDGGLGVL